MPSYKVTDSARAVVGTRTSKDAALKLIKADLWYRGDFGPYRINDEEFVYVAGFTLSRVAIKTVLVVKRTDNQALDPRYPTGVPPVLTPDIQVATPAGLTLTAGNAISQALASYVTGADASGYVMSLVAVTGTLVGVGGVLTTTTLSGTSVQGSFTYRLRVTKSGYTFDAPATTQIVVSAAVVTDTLPTTIPAFSTITVNTNIPRMELAGDYPMDIRSASIGPTDPVSVDVYKSIDGSGYSLLTTKTAAVAQPNPIMTGSAIGGATAATFSYSGGAVTISNAVDGVVSNSTDQCNFFGGSVTLPVGARVGVTLPAYTAAYGYCVGGLMIRQSRTALAPCLMLWRRPDASGLGTPMLSRAQQGGALSYTKDAVINGVADVVIERLAADQWRFDQYDATGNIIAVTTHTVAMTGSIEVGVFFSREAPGSAVSITFPNFWVSSQARWTYNDTAVSTGHTYNYLFRGKDAVGTPNVSAESLSITGSLVSAATNSIKYHPGDYAWFAGVNWYRIDLADALADILNFIDSIEHEPSIKGIQILTIWGSFEGDTPGSYKYTSLDAILSRCQLRGKRMMLLVSPGWAGNIGSNYDIFPKYIVDDYGIVISTQVAKPTRSAKIWQAATMDRYIALIQALGARYNSHAYMEMISFPETAIGGITTDGFSNQALLTQIQRLIAATRTAWPNTGLRVSANDLAPDPLMVSLFETAKTYACALGGPDVWPATITQADRIYAGYNASRQLVYEVLIDKLPWAVEIQSPELSLQPQTGFPNGFSPAQLGNAAFNGYIATQGSDAGFVQPAYKAKYRIWYVNTWAGNATTQWSTGELPYIRANPLPTSPPPTLYPGYITG